MIRVTREQLFEWRSALSWNDGAGLEPGDVARLLEEVERLQAEVELLRRARADRAPWTTAQ